MERIEIMNAIYKDGREDSRLQVSRQGQLEYAVTRHYIRKYIPDGSRILEVGAGTGRYSIALAREGHQVTAAELVQNNLDILRRNGKGVENLVSMQADAADLSCFADETFDAVLVLGPMYHLFEEEDCRKCLSEAVRVCREGGFLFFAFLSAHAMMMTNYYSRDFKKGFEMNFDESFRIRHFKEQGFTGYGSDEIEPLFADLPVRTIALAGVDGMMEIAERCEDFRMSDEDFEALLKYQIHTAERKDLIGAHSHLLYIAVKE